MLQTFLSKRHLLGLCGLNWHKHECLSSLGTGLWALIFAGMCPQRDMFGGCSGTSLTRFALTLISSSSMTQVFTSHVPHVASRVGDTLYCTSAPLAQYTVAMTWFYCLFFANLVSVIFCVCRISCLMLFWLSLFIPVSHIGSPTVSGSISIH